VGEHFASGLVRQTRDTLATILAACFSLKRTATGHKWRGPHRENFPFVVPTAEKSVWIAQEMAGGEEVVCTFQSFVVSSYLTALGN
jgi:hypothetical protein